MVDADQMNDTTASLRAEADAAILHAPPVDTGPAPVPPPVDQTEQMAAGYAALAGGVLGMTFELVAPAWAITEGETDQFAAALGKACALWFPGDIPEKWVALIVVAGVGAQIVAKRRDPVTGGLKPRFFPVVIVPVAPVATAAP